MEGSLLCRGRHIRRQRGRDPGEEKDLEKNRSLDVAHCICRQSSDSICICLFHILWTVPVELIGKNGEKTQWLKTRKDVSYERILKHLKKILPEAEEAEIKRLLK